MEFSTTGIYNGAKIWFKTFCLNTQSFWVVLYDNGIINYRVFGYTHFELHQRLTYNRSQVKKLVLVNDLFSDWCCVDNPLNYLLFRTNSRHAMHAHLIFKFYNFSQFCEIFVSIKASNSWPVIVLIKLSLNFFYIVCWAILNEG